MQSTELDMSANVSTSIFPTTDHPEMYVRQSLFVITPSLLREISLYMNGIITPIICLVGLAGNSVGLWILRREPDKNRMTIYTYMFALMFTDNIYLFLGLLAPIQEILNWYDPILALTMQSYLLVYRGYTFIVLKHITSFLLIIMSFERLMAVLKPFTSKDSYLSRHPGAAITITVIVSAIYMIPFFIGFRVVTIRNPQNITIHTTIIESWYFDVFIVYTYVETVILHYICPAMVLSLNIMIAIVYARHTKQRSSMTMSKSSSNQTKITAIVLSVAVMYIVLSMPSLFLQTLIFIDDNYSFYGRHRLTFFFLVNLGDFLGRINSATDFFMYIFASNHYRGIVGAIACKCCTNDGKPVRGTSSMWSTKSSELNEAAHGENDE